MNTLIQGTESSSHGRQPTVTFYHDIEQDIDIDCDPGACRDAVSSLLEIEARHGITATYNVVGRLFTEQPELVQEIAAAGHEIAFHSCNHFSDWHPGYYESEVNRCRELSANIEGYRSPRSEWMIQL